MKIATIIARFLLGLVFLVFGLNAFLHFIPMKEMPQGLAGDFLKVFAGSGYIYVIGGVQVFCGLLLVVGRFVPLALTILAGMIFNIWVFHTLLAPQGFQPAIVVSILELFLLWSYRTAFAGILRP